MWPGSGLICDVSLAFSFPSPHAHCSPSLSSPEIKIYSVDGGEGRMYPACPRTINKYSIFISTGLQHKEEGSVLTFCFVSVTYL